MNKPTLEEARRWFSEHVREKDASCPCCGRKTSYRKVTLTRSHAFALILIYWHEPNEWFNINSYGRNIGVNFIDLGYNDLYHFGLLEKHKTKRGLWRLTDGGRLFVNGYAKCIPYVELFDSKPWYGVDGKNVPYDIDASRWVSIHDLWGKEFDMEEVYASRAQRASRKKESAV